MSEVVERPTPEAEKGVDKITVRLSGDARAKVRKLAAKQGISISEFVRRAVSNEAFLLTEIEQGSKVMLEDKHNRLRQLVMR